MNKTLKTFDIFALATGAMISSGIFVLPGLAFSLTGPSMALSYLIAGVLALTGALSIVELSTAMPMTGGHYFIIGRTFGPLAGTITGSLNWLALAFKSAFAIVGLSEVFVILVGGPYVVYALGLTAFFVVVNLWGVEESVRFQVLLVVALLALLIIVGFATVTSVEPLRLRPYFPRGFNASLQVTGLVFVSYGGLLSAASVAGELKHPTRSLPAGLIGATVVVTLLYVVVTTGVVGTVDAERLARSATPVADGAEAVMGTVGYTLVTVAAALAFVTTANGGIITASRFPLAMASDGLSPAVLTRMRAKRDVPYVSVVLTGCLIGGAVLLELELLVKAASAVFIVLNIMANLAVIVLREGRVMSYRPSFRVPWYPVTPVVSTLLLVFILADVGWDAFAIATTFVVLGVATYYLYGRRRARWSFAMEHLVERMTDRSLVKPGLERELHEIVLDRDGVQTDSFDELVRNSMFMEVDGHVTLDEVFRRAGETLADTMQVNARWLHERLTEREAASSTALSDFLAVPHVVDEAIPTLSFLIARAKEGVQCSPENESVQALFFLLGPPAQRNLHLRSLAAIAQLVQNPGFEQRWVQAKDHEAVQSLLLLGGRRR